MAEKILDALMITLPIVKNIFGLDVQICLCDKEKTIGVWYADSFRMDTPVGERIDPQKPGHDMMIKAMETGRGNSGILPEFVYGVAVDGIITPILEDGKIVGAVSAAVSIRDRKEIELSAENLNHNLINCQKIINENAQESSNLAAKLDTVRTFSYGIEELVKDTSTIVKKIQNNSHRSNILAINASIEAARVREKNNGFSVVANEMGDLAKISGESTKSISILLEKIFVKIKGIMEEINTLADISISQATTMEEMASSLDEITVAASRLEKISTLK